MTFRKDPDPGAELFLRIAKADFGEGDPTAQVDLRRRLAVDAKASETAAEVEALWDLLGTVEPPEEEDADDRPGLVRWLDENRVRAAALVACILLAVGLVGFIHAPGAPGTLTIETQAGERRIARLSDGSAIELSGNSRVVIHYDDASRRIGLSRGEVLFRVAHDANRPFLVDAGKGEIMAVGTAFNVRLDARDVVVTVVDGTVRVTTPSVGSDEGRGGVTGFVRRGEQIVYENRPDGAAHSLATIMTPPQQVDIEREIAWTRDMLEFRGEPLARVIEQLNRHGRRRIVLLDPRFGAIRIHGMLRVDDPDALMKLLSGSEALRGQEADRILRIETGYD